MAGATVAGSAPSLIKPGQAFAGTLSPYHDSMTLTLKGVDSLSNALYASYNGDLYESRNMGQSWFRSSISWPPRLDKRTAYFQRWHGLLYCSGTYVDTSSTKRMVLSRLKDGAWTRVLAGVAGSSANTRCVLDGNDNYLHIGEYGDPLGGPHLYRSSDGVSWEGTFANPLWRHIHAVHVRPPSAACLRNSRGWSRRDSAKKREQRCTGIVCNRYQAWHVPVGTDLIRTGEDLARIGTTRLHPILTRRSR